MVPDQESCIDRAFVFGSASAVDLGAEDTQELSKLC